MNVTLRNTNGKAIYLCVDGEPMWIAPYSSEIVFRGDDAKMTISAQIGSESYTEKPKRSFWKFSFYHDYHLIVEASYMFSGVRDGDAFNITEQSAALLEPEGLIYESAVIHAGRDIPFESSFRVLGDRKALKKQYRKDHFKNGLFDFFFDPLIGFGADGCSFGCVATLLFWAIMIGSVVKFGFAAVSKWFVVIYLSIAVLVWALKGILDFLLRGCKTTMRLFDECFISSVIGEKLRAGDSFSQKKSFFGKKRS